MWNAKPSFECLHLPVDDTFISKLQTEPLKHKPLKKIFYRFHWLIKSLMRNIVTHFHILSCGKHISDNGVININKRRHFRGTFNLWIEICIKISLICSPPKTFFSQLSFVFFLQTAVMNVFTTLMLLKHALVTSLWHKASSAHRECKHITANLALALDLLKCPLHNACQLGKRQETRHHIRKQILWK